MREMTLPLLFTGLLLACSVAPAFSGQDDDAAKYASDLNEGISLLRAGSRDEISRAIAKFKSSLKVRPESAEAYYWLALAYSDQQNYLRAADNAKDATIYDDTLAEAWSLWGQVLLYQKDWGEALNKLETAARLDPGDPVTQYNLGRVYYHGFKDADMALAKFRAAWQIGGGARRDNPEMIPLTVKSRYYMGCCEYDRGVRNGNPSNFDMAINAFQDVVREQPNNYDALFRLALSLRRVNRSRESETILNALVEHLPKTGENVDRQLLAEVYLQLADLYLKDPVVKNTIFVQGNVQNFLTLIGDANHPAAEAAREYIDHMNRTRSEGAR